MGISDGHLTRVAPGTAQERERRIVELEPSARPNQSSIRRAPFGALENCQRLKGVCTRYGKGLAARLQSMPDAMLGGTAPDPLPWRVEQRHWNINVVFSTTLSAPPSGGAFKTRGLRARTHTA